MYSQPTQYLSFPLSINCPSGASLSHASISWEWVRVWDPGHSWEVQGFRTWEDDYILSWWPRKWSSSPFRIPLFFLISSSPLLTQVLSLKLIFLLLPVVSSFASQLLFYSRPSLKSAGGFPGNPRFCWICSCCYERRWSCDEPKPGSSFSFSSQLCLETIDTWQLFKWFPRNFPQRCTSSCDPPRSFLQLPLPKSATKTKSFYFTSLAWMHKSGFNKAVFCWPVKNQPHKRLNFSQFVFQTWTGLPSDLSWQNVSAAGQRHAG